MSCCRYIAEDNFIGLSKERPIKMMRLKLRSWFQWNARIIIWNAWNASNSTQNTRISFWNAQNSWFPLKSVSFLGIGDWRLSRKIYDMRAFRKTLTRYDNSGLFGFFSDMFWRHLTLICFSHLVNYSVVIADGSAVGSECDVGCMYYAFNFGCFF